MPVYSIEFIPRAARAWRRLTPQVRRQLEPVIQALAVEPRPVGVTALRGRPDWLRVRSGDYRIVYEVDDTGSKVRVLRIGHRRDIYDHLLATL